MKANQPYFKYGLFILFCLLAYERSSAQLKADFTSNVQSGCAPLIVAFENKSSVSDADWTWILGNGTVSPYQNPVTTYFDPGTYTVKLVIKNSSGADSITKTSYITVYANPQVVFNALPTQGCFPLDVNFTNSSKAGSGTIAKYIWDFGDGNIDSTANTSHKYISAGVFDVTLKIINSFGCYNALTKSDLIQINNGVNADFALTSFNVCKTPATAVFKNSSSGSDSLTYQWSFGDSETSTAVSPTHNYNTSGSYNVLLTVQSSSGCSDTASMPLVVDFPKSSFIHTDATCLNQTLHFTNTSIPAPISCTWYFGDGTTSTSLNPDKVYKKIGNFTVKLVNIFSSACSDSAINNISIASGPTASFTADDTSKCIAPLTVNFTNKTTGEASNFLWDFGDGSTSTDANPQHIYTTAGIFTVKLTAINSNGCQDVFTKTNYIYIEPVKITQLKNLPDSGCIPFTVKPSLDLNIDAQIKNYSWDFDDGYVSNDQFPSHTYTKEGFYNIKVTIETTDGCTDTYIKNNAVLAGHKPVADFIVNKDTICARDIEEFTNNSSNGPITFVRWDYGPFLDSASGRVYKKTPVDTGFVYVSLIAYNYGCADTMRKRSVYVLPPIAKIKFTQHCDDKLRVDFADSSIVPLTHKWDFGDNSTSTIANPTHVYATPGNYNVSLYVTNNTCYDSISSSVHVIKEVGTINLTNTVYCRGNTIAADILGVNVANIKNTTWNFGDGTIITVNGATKANHIYLVNGRFKIKATMMDRNNCQYLYETKDSITIYGPLAAFTTTTPGACQGSTVSFTDKSSADGIHNIIKWSWNYGDNIDHIYAAPSVFSHLYPDTGYYSVRLTVTDSYGCSDSSKRNDYIFITHPHAFFAISDSVACPKKQVSFQNTSYGKDLKYVWDFGDGAQSNQRNPSYTYNKSGFYNPELTVTDVNNCRDSFKIDSLKISNPIAKFLMSDSVSTCPPLEVKFTNNSMDFTAVTWNFGDGSPSVITSPTHIYTYPGRYPVKLIVNGYGSCADTATGNIIIKGPTAKMTYNTLPMCYPDTTKFSAATTNVVLYTWDFSDGNAVSTVDDHIAYVYQPGNYVPKLIVQDSAGCKVSIKGEDTVIIYDVKANADASQTAVCDSTPVQFKDLSVSADKIVHYYWFFGDGSSSDGQTETHSYAASGNYNVYSIVETKTGCRDTFNFSQPIKVLPTPQIKISGDSSICSMATASFKANSTLQDSSIKWNWNLGNGSTTSGDTTSSVYDKSGNYTVTLTATAAGGCSDTTSKTIYVNPLPKVQAGNDTMVCQNNTYQLNASGAQTYTWSGGELSCTNCASPVIKPNAQTTYMVIGKDANGCIASDTISISVIEPTAIKVYAGDTLCVGETLQFNASGMVSYQWSPPVYLNSYTSANPVFSALKDTSINYRVIGYTAQHCFADTAFVFVKTYPVPQFKLPQDEITLNAGSSVQLNAVSSPDITQWRWQPPQGLSNTTIPNPIASPTQTTTYSCVASNGGACVSRDQITVRVVCGHTNVFIPNTFSPNNDGVNDVFYPRGTGLFLVKSFRVFNRWGQVVFERFNASPNNADDGWNGKFNGKNLKADVYVFIIEMVCENNVIIPIKGNVTLLQ